MKGFLLLIFIFIGCSTEKPCQEKEENVDIHTCEEIHIIASETPVQELPEDIKKICAKHNYNSVGLSLEDLKEAPEEVDLSMFFRYKLPHNNLVMDSASYVIFFNKMTSSYFIQVNNGFTGISLFGPGKL